MESNLYVLIIFLVIIIVLFIIFRELNCWYWKINERLELQKETVSLLRQLVSKNSENGNLNSVNQTKNYEKKALELLSDDERLILATLKNQILKKGDRVIFNISTRKLIKVNHEEWALKYMKDNNWEVISEFE